MFVSPGFTHTKILLEERGPGDGCEVGFTHTIILLKRREDKAMVVRLVLPTQ